MREKLLELAQTSGDLPPLPDVLIKVQAAMSDPKTGIKDISKHIEIEPVLAGRIMKLSNNAIYGRAGKEVKTLSAAITKLGLNEIIKIIYSFELKNSFSNTVVIDSTHFWRHSLAVAVFSQSLGRIMKFDHELLDQIYLAGLMHDIGVMVFAFIIPDEYRLFLKQVFEKYEPLEVQEYNRFGIDHAELGACFIQKWWKLDEKNCCDPIRKHHLPLTEAGNMGKSGLAVNLANKIINAQGVANGVFAVSENIPDEAWHNLGFTTEEAQSILGDVNNALTKAAALMKM